MKNWKIRNTIGIVLIVISFILLIPGLIEPMITFSGSIKILVIKKQVFNDTRSIWLLRSKCSMIPEVSSRPSATWLNRKITLWQV
jgi:hypothetical protein